MKEKEYNLMQFINMKFFIFKNLKIIIQKIRNNSRNEKTKTQNNEIVDLPNLEQKQTKHGRDKEAENNNKTKQALKCQPKLNEPTTT